MKSRTFKIALYTTLITLLAAATAMPMAAQDNKAKHPLHCMTPWHL